MTRRPEIGSIQLYPSRPLRASDKNGFVLKFYCPIAGARIRRNCGTRDRSEARRILRECRERLLNGKYQASNGAITEAQAAATSPGVAGPADGPAEKSWQECYDSFRQKWQGRSIDHTISRLSIAERIFNARLRKQGKKSGLTVGECLNDDGIEYLQTRLLAGDEGRYSARSPATVNSIVKMVMTFARFCRRKKWIKRMPHAESIGQEKYMKGRPIVGEEFERMLAVVPKVVGVDSAESWRFALRVLWESTFRIGDVMDFSWDDSEHIHPVWPKKAGDHPTLMIPCTQKNGENQEIPMLPGLAKLLNGVPVNERVGWVVDPQRVEYEIHTRKKNWFMPTSDDLAELAARYSNSAIGRACNVSETAVRKWLKKHGVSRAGQSSDQTADEVSAKEIAAMKERAKRQDRRIRRHGNRLTVERVSRIIAQIGREAKIVVCKADPAKGVRVKYASAHDLRRGGALRLINAGVSAESLQVVMRHKDFGTTQKFYGATRAAQAAAAEVYTKLGAAGQLTGGLTGGIEPKRAKSESPKKSR